MKGLNEDLHLRLSKFRGYYWLFSQDEFLEVELLGQVLLKDFGYIVPSCSLEKIIHFILPSTVYESICFSLLSLSFVSLIASHMDQPWRCLPATCISSFAT